MVPPDPAKSTLASLSEHYGEHYRWISMATVTLASFITTLSGSVTDVAIPQLMGTFGMSLDQGQWLSSGFLAANTVCLLLSTMLAQRYGIRWTMCFSLLVFCLGSVLAAVANTSMMVVAARFLQGGASGIIQPLTILVIAPLFPIERRGLAMGLSGVGMLLGPPLGPILAGWLIDIATWRYAFWMQAPLAIACLGLATRFLPRSGPFDSGLLRENGRDHVLSIALLCVAVLSLIKSLSDFQALGRGYEHPYLYLFISLVSAIALVSRELHTPTPLIELRLLRFRRFAAATGIMFIIGFVLFGSSILIPLYLQSVIGVPAIQTGMVLMPAGLLMAVISPFAGHVSDRFAPRIIVWAGLALMALFAFAQIGLTRAVSLVSISLWVVVGRTGMALIFPALYGSALKAVPLSKIGQAAGIINVSRQLGGSLGVACMTLVYNLSFHEHLSKMTEAFSDQGARGFEVDQQLFGAEHGVYSSIYLSSVGKVIRADASSLAIQDTFFLLGVALVLFFPIAWFLGGREALAQQGDE